MSTWGVWLAAFALSFGFARQGNAVPAGPVKNDFDSASALSDDGWTEFAGGVSSFTGTAMAISSPNYDEWALDFQTDHPPVWWSYMNPARGWWVEARLKINAAAGAQGHGQALRIQDGYRDVSLKLGVDHVTLVTHTETPYAFDTRDFHVYRVQRPSAEQVELVIDGKQVLNVATPELDPNEVWGIVFGSTEANMSATWDYLSYDTAAPGTETRDDDQDGIPLDRDLCPDVKDDGKDTDHDRIGDACDACVNDMLNDADGDGLCADKDICPSNPNNPDANANGLCDDDECVAGMPKGYEYAPPGSEGAEVCQVGALQCLCYNRAKANCPPKSSCGFGCDCRYAGVAGAGGVSGAGGLGGANPTLSAGGTAGNGEPTPASDGGAAGASTSAGVSAAAGALASTASSAGAINARPSGSPPNTGAADQAAPSPSGSTKACALALQPRSSQSPAILWCLLGLTSLWRWRRRSARGARLRGRGPEPLGGRANGCNEL